MVFTPSSEWTVLASAVPSWRASLFGYVLPLALFPAALWPAGQMASDSPPPGWTASAPQFASAFTTTLALALASVVLLAAAFYVLAPVFDVRRSWDRSMTVAAYSSTPVLLAAPLLVSPVLAIGTILGLFHGLALCYLGLQEVQRCRESESALFVAAASFCSGLALLVLGGLCSAAGVL
jgi:hypothetical protein